MGMMEVTMAAMLKNRLIEKKAVGIYCEIKNGVAVVTDCKKNPFELIAEKSQENTNLILELNKIKNG